MLTIVAVLAAYTSWCLVPSTAAGILRGVGAKSVDLARIPATPLPTPKPQLAAPGAAFQKASIATNGEVIGTIAGGWVPRNSIVRDALTVIILPIA